MGHTLNNHAQIRPEPGSLTARRDFTAPSLVAISPYGLWAVAATRWAWAGWKCPSGLKAGLFRCAGPVGTRHFGGHNTPGGSDDQ